jgi:hypothetical protein
VVAWNAAEYQLRESIAQTIISKRETLKQKFQNMSYKEVFVKINSVLAFGLIALVFAGCSRCEECQLQGGSETICETEFDNPDQYEDAIADREIQGASCTSTGGF